MAAAAARRIGKGRGPARCPSPWCVAVGAAMGAGGGGRRVAVGRAGVLPDAPRPTGPAAGRAGRAGRCAHVGEDAWRIAEGPHQEVCSRMLRIDMVVQTR